MNPSPAQRARRIRRPWRAALVVYALALTLGTHWPKLRLGTETVPAPDKLLHMLAFGGLFVLVWRTGWTRRLWLAGALVAAWAALDEGSQGLPVLHRTSSWQDMLASELGVAVAVAWCWAQAPMGGVANRMHTAWNKFLFEEVFARPRAWIIVALVGAAGAAAGAAITVLAAVLVMVLGLVPPKYPDDLPSLLAIALLAGLASAQGAVAALCHRHAATLAVVRPCFACGAPCRDADFNDSGQGRCPGCAAAVHRGQWIGPSKLRTDRRDALRIVFALWIPALVGLIPAFLGLIVATPVLLSLRNRLPGDMIAAMIVAPCAIGAAVGVRVFRLRMARLYDGQHLQCRHCNHNLTGATVVQGVGVCPECGVPFARFEG